MLAFVLILCIYCGITVNGAIPHGRAAWVYDVANGQPAMWSTAISSFNNNTNYPINTIYSYGGDMEYYPGSAQPYETYFTASNQQAAQIYSQIPGVSHVITVIDGRMDGGQSWSPDLSKLNSSQIKQWADVTAALYCSFPQVSGLQIDLEPFRPPYVTNLLLFLSELAQDLTSGDFNCVNDQYPEGRVLSTFLFAEMATEELYSALGPLGFAIISGYDLSNASAGVVSTPEQYGVALEQCIKTTLQNLQGVKGFFTLGLPTAASTHEFERYVMANGDVTQGYPIWTNSSDDNTSYMEVAYQAIKQAGLAQEPSYLGPSFWGFSSMMSYPSGSDNLFFPSNPFATPGEEEWLKTTEL